MVQTFDLYWISEAGINWKITRKGSTSSGDGLIVGDVSADVLATISTIAVVVLSSILIACLKKQTAAFKVFTNPKVVYIGLISTAVSPALGALDQSLDYWYPLVSVPFQAAPMV